MSSSRVRIAEIAALVLSVGVFLSLFLPWVRTGVLEETDTINGSEIPVLNWMAGIMMILGIVAAGLAVAFRNKWLWGVEVFLMGLMVTGATVVLSTLDVMDSAVVGWITRLLPEQIRDSSPQLQATVSLWCSYLLTLGALTAGSLAAIWRSSPQDEDLDEWNFDSPEYDTTWVTSSTDERPSWL